MKSRRIARTGNWFISISVLFLSLGIATNRHDHAIANIFLFEVNNRPRQLEAPLIKVTGRFYITARQLIGRTRRTCALWPPFGSQTFPSSSSFYISFSLDCPVRTSDSVALMTDPQPWLSKKRSARHRLRRDRWREAYRNFSEVIPFPRGGCERPSARRSSPLDFRRKWCTRARLEMRAPARSRLRKWIH